MKKKLTVDFLTIRKYYQAQYMANATAAWANPGSRVIAFGAYRRYPGSIHTGRPLNEPGVTIEATVLEVTGMTGKRGELHQSRRCVVLASTEPHERPGSEMIIDGQFRNYLAGPDERVAQELRDGGHQVVLSQDTRGEIVGVAVRRMRRPGEPIVTETDGSDRGEVYSWRGERGM